MKGQGASARHALSQGNLALAVQLSNAMIHDRPQDGEGYFVFAMAASEAGQITKAVPLVEAALARDPGNAEYLAQYARLLILMRRDGEAALAARMALNRDPGDARTFDTIGCVLARLADHEGAWPAFEAAVQREPANLDFRYNLAATCGFTGRVEEARGHYEAILSQAPDDARSHYGLAILSRQTPTNNHTARLADALERASDEHDLLRLRYALAKEMEDIGLAKQAFGQLSTANAGHKQALGYDFGQDEAIFDAIEGAFANSASRIEPGHSDAAPIFVVGMPRTGTTLVDRILSSHAEVISAGELQALPLAVKQAAGSRSRLVIDAETVRGAMQADPAEIGRLYMARAAHHLPSGTRRFVDKLPANFLYIGHILRSLPNARVVCLRRNPMDTVWSNFRNLFASQSAYYAYSYDLLDTARYYARFDRLMAFWERVFPGAVLQFDYEELVQDQEAQTRRLLDHCGLPWDAACLSFHENKAAVATPSAAQVRRRLNADGIGRWKAHEEGMTQVRTFFEGVGIPTA